MLAMVGVLDLEATSADRSVLQLLDYMREHTMLTRDHIPDRVPLFDEQSSPVLDPLTGEQRVRIFDTSFASENWNKAIRDRARPGMFVRRHLEAYVLTYLAEELRTGDIAVLGAANYANWADQLLTPAEVAVLLPAFCAEVGIPGTAAEFRADLQTRLDTQCRGTDAAYPDLADFTIDDNGRPSLKQYRAAPATKSAQALALALRDRMPERTFQAREVAARARFRAKNRTALSTSNLGSSLCLPALACNVFSFEAKASNNARPSSRGMCSSSHCMSNSMGMVICFAFSASTSGQC
jgi:hypothetical protein